MFEPNYKTAGYKTKSDAMTGIIESFMDVPNSADKEGNLVFILGKNILKLKPNKKKPKETYEKKSE